MSKSEIAWTESTWNPVTGCTKASPGCRNCYASKMAKRLQAMGQPNYVNGFAVTTHAESLETPKGWRKPQVIFVCSMSDLFHEDVPFEFIKSVFAVMSETPQHVYQVLTKRPERMVELSRMIEWPKNVWAGVTIEHNDYVSRGDLLRAVQGPSVRFVSAEPLLGPLTDLSLIGVDQLIVGGESGSGWRPMEVDWVRELRERCVDTKTAFFFKQFAGFRPKKLGRELDGVTWGQMPNQEDGAA